MRRLAQMLVAAAAVPLGLLLRLHRLRIWRLLLLLKQLLKALTLPAHINDSKLVSGHRGYRRHLWLLTALLLLLANAAEESAILSQTELVRCFVILLRLRHGLVQGHLFGARALRLIALLIRILSRHEVALVRVHWLGLDVSGLGLGHRLRHRSQLRLWLLLERITLLDVQHAQKLLGVWLGPLNSRQYFPR
jgi:hypothetical protein